MSCGSRISTVHPRSRGEHVVPESKHVLFLGSSPLARGTRGVWVGGQPVQRFIPARAGNTSSGSAPTRRPTVHPRSRGEHYRRRANPLPATGSSPLARGTRHGRAQAPEVRRFIPARAGNTAAARARRCGPPVHPRSRGEHTREGTDLVEYTGSSPLARGTPARGYRGIEHDRFIPARAGNTGRSPSSRCRMTVHPRSRGEHGSLPSRPDTANGSSPLARGTPGSRCCRSARSRFIPARAGNTNVAP